jgi:hypothetical protein
MEDTTIDPTLTLNIKSKQPIWSSADCRVSRRRGQAETDLKRGRGR